MKIKDIVLGQKKKNTSENFLSGLLQALSPFYYAGLNIHKGLYNTNIKKIYTLSKPVICVGNLTLGGSGKTPIVEKLTNIFLHHGIKPAILSRGYKRKITDEEIMIVSDGNNILKNADEAGDEPVQLAFNCPKVPIIVSNNRFAAGMTAVNNFNSEAFILDDGYQHWALKKDYNILCISASENFIKSKLLPAGTRREPFSALKRSDIIILTNASPTQNPEKLAAFIKKFDSTKRLILTEHSIKSIIPISSLVKTSPKASYEEYTIDKFESKRLFVFCGIANNNNFFNSLYKLNLNIISKGGFDDHHKYTVKDIEMIIHKAKETKADAIITTQKDAVKLYSFPLIHKSDIPFYFTKLEIIFLNDIYEEILFENIKEKVKF